VSYGRRPERSSARRPARPALILHACALLVALAACSAPRSTSPEAPRVGADRDEHGCIASAGYTWCAREHACVRPWELAGRQGFELSPASIRRYCADGMN
jgi:hypothetical protein